MPQAETIGCIGMYFVDFRKTTISCCLGVGTMRSWMGVFYFRDELVVLLVWQNFNEFLVDNWGCIFGEMLIN